MLVWKQLIDERPPEATDCWVRLESAHWTTPAFVAQWDAATSQWMCTDFDPNYVPWFLATRWALVE